MFTIKQSAGELSPSEQDVITRGFERHSLSQSAPPFMKTRYTWLAHDAGGAIVGALTADLLWDWLYVDELWTDESQRGKGLGRQLMMLAEEFAGGRKAVGLWLWTQSWQAADFYKHLGYREFARFEDFPRGHARIGLRKYLSEGALPV